MMSISALTPAAISIDIATATSALTSAFTSALNFALTSSHDYGIR